MRLRLLHLHMNQMARRFDRDSTLAPEFGGVGGLPDEEKARVAALRAGSAECGARHIERLFGIVNRTEAGGAAGYPPPGSTKGWSASHAREPAAAPGVTRAGTGLRHVVEKPVPLFTGRRGRL
jgi:hypothetical protein